MGEPAVELVERDFSDWEQSYRPLPYLFFWLMIVWTILAVVWTLNTWTKRRWQTCKLQWVLTAVPVLKALVLCLSFEFWYSCLNLSTCSFWVGFGVFVSRIFFETACFVSFLLISHGYCIMHEQLSVRERRSVAGLASVLYLALTGYKAAVPRFVVLVMLTYAVLLYVIMAQVRRNLALLREQLQQVRDEGAHTMHTAVYTKFTMFKRFQGALLMMVVAQIWIHTRAEGVASEYWMRLLVGESVEIIIFFYIGWIFRSRELTPFFTVIPTLHSSGQHTLPPIFSVEMNEKDFNNLDYKEWHIGVSTSVGQEAGGQWPVLVIVQNPGKSSFGFKDDLHSSENLQTAYSIPASLQQSSVLSSPPPRTPQGSDPSCSLVENLELLTTAPQPSCKGFQQRPPGPLHGPSVFNRCDVGSVGGRATLKESAISAARDWGWNMEGDQDFGRAEGYTALKVDEVVVDVRDFQASASVPLGMKNCDPAFSQHSSLRGYSATSKIFSQSLLPK